MAEGIRGENVYSVFLQPPCTFRRVIGVQPTGTIMRESLASGIHHMFPFLWEIILFDFHHIDIFGPRWLIETAWLHWQKRTSLKNGI